MSSLGFSSQKDYFGFAAGKAHCVKSSNGYAVQTATAPNDHGDIIASDVFGREEAPSCEYKISQELTGSDFPDLGSVTPVGSDSGLALPLMLTQLSITTGAGTEPSVTLSGVGVEPGATTRRTFDLSTIGTLSPLYKAQILAGAGSVTGGSVTSATLTAAVESGVTEVTGEPVASDCWGGTIEVVLTIVCPLGAKPTVAPGANWDITGALTVDDTDGDYQSWSCTLTKPLTATDPAGA